MQNYVAPHHAPSGDSALDFARLQQLQRQTRLQGGSGMGVSKADAEIARQFEALLIAQLLKQARQTSETAGAGLFDSPQTQLAQSLGDAQLAQNLSAPGLGLAQILLWQMKRAAGNVLGADPAHRAPGATPHPPHPARPARPDSAADPAHAPLHATTTRPRDAASISELIAKLTHLTKQAGAVVSAIRSAPQHVHDFVARVSGAVHTAAQKSGVPAKLILSQAALESAWGQREIRHQDGSPTHNVFGIKASPGWAGKVAQVTTTEYRHGKPQCVVQTFRAYDSYEHAFADYARLMRTAPRYREVALALTPEDAARRVQQAGYATDPAYADKLIKVMDYLQEAREARNMRGMQKTGVGGERRRFV